MREHQVVLSYLNRVVVHKWVAKELIPVHSFKGVVLEAVVQKVKPLQTQFHVLRHLVVPSLKIIS